MEPLLRITTIPLKYELKIQKARLEYKRSTAELQMNRQKGEMSVENHPTKVSIDTFNARNSVCPTTMESVTSVGLLRKSCCVRSYRKLCRGGCALVRSQNFQSA